MPKAKNTWPVVTNKGGKRQEMDVVGTEPIELKKRFPQAATKPNYAPIAPVHFQELSNIWENNRRIPTIASRTAWSLARNLNPINVNRWWYRRKVVAKKFKINIPGDSYELDVGIPPLVVIKSEELPTSIHASESASSDTAFSNSRAGDTLVDLSSSTCADHVTSSKKSSEYTYTAVKDAYIHDSKLSEDVIVASDCTTDILAPAPRDSSPLPPSSPIIWPSSSPPPVSRIASPEVDPDLIKESTITGSDCILVLDHGSSASTENWKPIDLVAELDGPFEKSSLLLTRFQPCQWSEAFLSFYAFPTWCFAGLRTAYDGSVVCDCLCSTKLEPCSGNTHLSHLTPLVLTDDLELEGGLAE